jgi:leucyl/phenylalanyl-tRNA--protein transferase
MFPHLSEDQRITFPDPREASREGLLGQGANLSPGVLLSAYETGIFPWFGPDDPILWWSPDPRFVLYPRELHVPRSLKKLLRKNPFTYSWDVEFERVISLCSSQPRPGQDGTWITGEMAEAYGELHRLGYAHSLEVWRDGELAGGLYGVSLGKMFFGESMFSLVSGASKAAFVVLVRTLGGLGFPLVDCQVHTPHLEALGAREIPRGDFLDLLERALKEETLRGSWTDLATADPLDGEESSGQDLTDSARGRSSP